MKRCSLVLLALILLESLSLAQGNIDWEELWVVLHPNAATGWNSWMFGDRRYTGIAYDRFRDVIYIVSPDMCTVGSTTYPCPKIHIWDAQTGYTATIGRDAVTGQGGVLPVPLDTIVAATAGWPGGSYGGFNKGQFALYKIDVDDEGRIFACNLVSPLWGECYPGPPPNCDSSSLNQGPFRIYRWDTPTSTPKLVYASLNAAHNGIGTALNSEMTGRRWGDALDVTGKRVWVHRSANDSVLVDSARIYVAGGFSNQTPNLNDEIAVFLTDTMLRTPQSRISNGAGGWMDYRLGIKLLSPYANKAGHGLAVTGSASYADIWMDHSTDNPRLGTQRQTGAALPQTYTMTFLDSTSSNLITGAGLSGPLAYFQVPLAGLKFLITADGQSGGTPNYNTRARVMNATTRNQIFRQPGMGDTPYLNNRPLQLNGGSASWISDVDCKIPKDSMIIWQGDCPTIFVLMSNNGIASYGQRSHLMTGCFGPVEFRQFTAIRVDHSIQIRWTTESETNNRGFEIQRSFAGAEWLPIAFVDGHGTTSDEHRYTYDDPITPEHTSAGRITYRLKQIDLDGSSEYSPTAEVFVESASFPVLEQSFPNPVSLASMRDRISTVKYSVPAAGPVSLKLYSISGEEIATLTEGMHGSGAYAVRYDVSGLVPGTYLYRLTASGTSRQQSFVVIR
jgi:hypothetical protein